MSTRRLAVVCAATILLAGCGGDGDDMSTETPATADEAGEGPVDGEPADAEGGGDEGSGEVEPDADSELSTGTADGEADDSEGFEDVTLDVEQRHPGGAVLQVSGVRFEGNTVLVDAEFINGATDEVRISTAGGDRLRLLDDLGHTYNFVAPDDAQDQLVIAVGESVGGAFAFLGPLDRGATTLTLAANVYDPVEPLVPEDLYDGTRSPEFVLEGLDLR